VNGENEFCFRVLGFAGRPRQRQQLTGVRGRRGESERRETSLWRLCARRRFLVAVAEARGSLSMSIVDSFNSSSSCFGEELLLDVRD
jgi:hypothetical protein